MIYHRGYLLYVIIAVYQYKTVKFGVIMAEKKSILRDIKERTIVTARFEDGEASAKVGVSVEINGRSAAYFIDVSDPLLGELSEVLGKLADKFELEAADKATRALFSSGI